MRTQVGIVGAGPAGLLLSHLLQQHGIESVILENRSRAYIEQRVRAGVLEHGTVETLISAGVGERMLREGLVHHGIELRFSRQRHRIPLTDLTGGRSIMIYGQQELVKDLVRARLEVGGPLLFEVDRVRPLDLESERPRICFEHAGAERELRCDFVAGCDGFHGVSRPSMPSPPQSELHHEYPYAWVGILAAVAPSTDEVVYAHHERGLAMHSLRSPELSRLYLQCDPDDSIENWSDDRIWSELHTRLATDDGWSLTEGPILEKSITGMRAFVAREMSFGRLHLAGDAAHIVPPTGAKGLNLAVADVCRLADGLVEWFHKGSDEQLRGYARACLRRVWRVQQFSAFMTQLLHPSPDEGEFERELRLSQLRYVVSSEAAGRSLAENYVGLQHV